MMTWQGIRVLIIGGARQGLALARYLTTHGAQVTLNDQRNREQMSSAVDTLSDLPIRWHLGSHPLNLLEECDLVCLSGGVPLTLPIVGEALKRGIPLSNDSQIFFEAAPCRIIAITGSAGKTTTTTLFGRMAQAAVRHIPGSPRVWVGGNIGNPLIAYVDEMQPNDMAVVELSSFQLEQMTRSPHIAAVLNITPNHLDRHGTMAAYTAAKMRILSHQKEDDVAILNREDPGAWALASAVKGTLYSFGIQEPDGEAFATFVRKGEITLRLGALDLPLMPINVIALRGRHNLQNVLAACALGAAAGFPASAMQNSAADFYGVPHRLELVRTWKGVTWYNDSIATAPERSIAAIHSFEEPLVLLAGGRDKDLPWDKFAEVVQERVDHLILFGEAAEIISQAMENNPGRKNSTRPHTIQRCADLHTAVLAAAQTAEAGDVVLLSPGGTSFDEFKDFEERGERYRTWVNKLT